MIQDEDIRCQLRLGEDSQWEFKRIEFSGNTPSSPRRDDLADELGAFANADGGMVLFPNKTWVRATTDEAGDAALDLYTTNLPMTIYVAAPGYAAGLERAWTPNRGGLLLELEPLESGGATIFAQSTGHLPGLRGRLNPIRDTSDRTYLYADNIAIDEGRQQPVPFRPGKPVRLTDAHGSELSVTIVDILGRSALIESRRFE